MSTLADMDPIQICRNALTKSIASNSLEIPVMPHVAGEVLALTNNPKASIEEFSALIHKDQALAGYVLKIANSAAYGGGANIVSLQQAIARLGMKLLGDIAISISMRDGVFSNTDFGSLSKMLFKHALTSGVYAKEVARTVRRNIEGQFLCGMLHTVGKPVALKLIADLSKKHGIQLDVSGAETLIDEFHIQVGQTVATRWNLPQLIQVTGQHYLNYKEAPTFQDETAMTYLSDLLATWVVLPHQLSEDTLRADSVFQELNFYPDDVDELLNKKDEIMSVVNSLS